MAVGVLASRSKGLEVVCVKRNRLACPDQLFEHDKNVQSLLFNSAGVFDFLISVVQGAQNQIKVGMSPDQIDHSLKMRFPTLEAILIALL